MGTPQEPAPQSPNILATPDALAGVFANWAQVSLSEHEFTVDFARMDPTAPPPGTGVLVSRIAMSSVLMRQLLNLLEAAWADYAEKVIGGEVENDGQDEPQGDPEG
jgi:hypothetical protein